MRAGPREACSGSEKVYLYEHAAGPFPGGLALRDDAAAVPESAHCADKMRAQRLESLWAKTRRPLARRARCAKKCSRRTFLSPRVSS